MLQLEQRCHALVRPVLQAAQGEPGAAQLNKQLQAVEALLLHVHQLAERLGAVEHQHGARLESLRRSVERVDGYAERGLRESQQILLLTRRIFSTLDATEQDLLVRSRHRAGRRLEPSGGHYAGLLEDRRMSGSTLGTLFRVTNFGESHGPAIGCVIDGCPPGMALPQSDIQGDLDRRRPGTSRHVTQRNEADAVEILSGIYEGLTTGTPIALLIRNTDQRSKDYGNILDTFRPGHADYTYWQEYGLRDPRGGGRASARLTAPTVRA